MLKSFSIKTLPNWVFAVLIGAFWLDNAREETLFARFDVWMVCLALLTVYLAMQRNPQNEWVWEPAQLIRCGFALISAVIVMVVVGGSDVHDESAYWGLLIYIGSNWALAYAIRKYFYPPNDGREHLIYAMQHGDFEPLRIAIHSRSEQHLKLQTVLLCAFLCVLGFWLTGLQAEDLESTTDKLIVAFISVAILLLVGFKWLERNNDFKALRLLSESDGEYLDISPQGLAWRVLSNHAPKWQQELRPQFRLDQHHITWPQLKSVQVLADGSSDNPITYLWLTAIDTHTGELWHLRINETHTDYTSKQLCQLLLQYHNLGMKPFHTVGKKTT